MAVDHQHSYLCNVYICHCLMTAIATVLLRKSDDPTTTTALLLSRTVVCISNVQELMQNHNGFVEIECYINLDNN